jgi:hypothetical protein
MDARSRRVPAIGDTAMLRAVPASAVSSVCALTLKLVISRPNINSDFHATAMMNDLYCDTAELMLLMYPDGWKTTAEGI